MLKNKDGSYNKVPFILLSLIVIISICLAGMLIIQNLPKVELPEIYTPSLDNVSTIVSNITSPIIYNSTDVSNISWNQSSNTTYNTTILLWNQTNSTTWTLPANTTSVEHLIITGNVSYGGGGAASQISNYTIPSYNATYGYSGNSTNYYTTYYYAGGGGGTPHTSGVISNTTPNIPISQTSPAIQNVSSLIISLGNQFVSGEWYLVILIFIFFPVTLILFNSEQALSGILIILLCAGFFIVTPFSTVLSSVGMVIIIYILMTRFIFDR
jgi:hypothetical protein